MKRILKRLKMIGRIGAVAIICPLLVNAGDNKTEVTIVDGIVETGLNRFLSQPVLDFGGDLGTFGADFLGEYNPNGPLPIPLTPASGPDTILSTFIDRAFQLAFIGIPADEIDPSGENLPLRDVLVQSGPSVLIRDSLPGHASAPPFTLTRSEPNDPITLGDWVRAKGRMQIRCHGDGTSTVRVSFTNLIPNGVYSMWHVATGVPPVILIPLGGVPNVFVPDEDGDAKFKRDLSFCPTAEDSPTLVFIAGFHYDGAAFGGFPDAPLEALYGGVVTGEHMIFPINVTVLAP